MLTLALGSLVTPLATPAQPPTKIYRVGVLWLGSQPVDPPRDPLFATFLQGLHDLGYVAAQQYYVYTLSSMVTGTWQPYVKNYAPNTTFDYGGRAAALWLDR